MGNVTFKGEELDINEIKEEMTMEIDPLDYEDNTSLEDTLELSLNLEDTIQIPVGDNNE